VYVTGTFKGTADMDPGPDTFQLDGSFSYSNVFICKLNVNGEFLWAGKLGGNNIVESTAIAVDAAGNVFTTGSFWGLTDLDPGIGTFELDPSGFYDMFISKLDGSGNFIWAKQFGSQYSVHAFSLVVDGDGDVHVTGHFSGTADFDPGPGTHLLTTDYQDIFILELTGAGDLDQVIQLGSGGYDLGASIAVNTVNEVFVTGVFSGTVDFDPGPLDHDLNSFGETDIFILKLGPGTPTTISNIQISEFSMYPNPTSGRLWINTTRDTLGMIRLFDVTGRMMLQRSIHSSTTEVDLKQFSAGTYFVEVSEQVFKVVKE
jgi:hypothetical protein